MADIRLVGPPNPIAIALPWHHVGQIAMKDVIGPLRQNDTLEFAMALVVEQAEFHSFRVEREQREVDAPSVPRGTEPVGRAGLNTHRHPTGPRNTTPNGGRVKLKT